jgi:hypothetical protein
MCVGPDAYIRIDYSAFSTRSGEIAKHTRTLIKMTPSLAEFLDHMSNENVTGSVSCLCMSCTTVFAFSVLWVSTGSPESSWTVGRSGGGF